MLARHGRHRRRAARRPGAPHHAVPDDVDPAGLRLRRRRHGLAAAREPRHGPVRQRLRLAALDLRLLGPRLRHPRRGHLDRPGRSTTCSPAPSRPLLILWHGIVGGRLFAREFRFFLLLGLAALLYALGRYTPVFEFVFDHVPGIDLYRRPADATFLINVALAFVVRLPGAPLSRRGRPRGSPPCAARSAARASRRPSRSSARRSRAPSSSRFPRARPPRR